MADSWDADDFAPEVPAVVAGKWDGEDVEDVPDAWDTIEEKEEEAPPDPEKTTKKSGKKGSKKNAVYADEKELTPKEREERSRARELEMTKDLFGSSSDEVCLFETEEGASSFAERMSDTIRKNKSDPHFVDFVIELIDRLTFDMESSSVKRIGKKVTEREKALHEQEREKAKGKKKSKPQLGSGKRTAGVLDDVLDGEFGGGGGGGGYGDDDDFM